MKLKHNGSNKVLICTVSLIVLVTSYFIFGFGCSKKLTKTTGRILSIEIPDRRFKPGETLVVHARVSNQSKAKSRFLLVLNILYGDKTVYDSHHGKKSHTHEGDECIDFWIDPRAEQRIGPFVYKIPDDASSGTYHVLAGLRKYPWEPLLMFRGAGWCPPETTFEVIK